MSLEAEELSLELDDDESRPLEQLATARACAWCRGPIPTRARADSRFCSTRCRQASHRFGRDRIRAEASTGPISVAYADPPYPGKAGLYRDHPDYAGEVDHVELVDRLVSEFPDGWAVSTSAEALPKILELCPEGTRVAAWVRGPRANPAALRPQNAWEPVLYLGGRLRRASIPGRRVDALVHAAKARTTDPDRVIGAKPAAFVWWMFELLGLEPHDELSDLFPGSGGVLRAWEIYTSSQVLDDGSRADPSSIDRARRLFELEELES